MKNYLILLSLLCCSLFSTIDSNLDEAWSIFLSKDQNARILEIALEVRSRSDKYSDLKDLEFILSDEINISTPDKLIPTILHFLSTELNFDTSQIIIEELSRNSLTSGREPVFLIYNSSHDLIMIVKGFTKVNLIQEISALEKLYSLHLNNSTTVAPLAVCSVKIKNLTLYFMAQTVAPGKSLIDVVSAINNTEGEDRAQKFNSIQKAVKRLSEAIAELHQNAPKTDLVTREFDYLDVFIPPFTLFQDVLEENGIEVNREELEAFCIDLGGMVTTYYPEHIYLYRDLNWGNIFYDEKDDRITFIDTGTFHWSIDGQGNPAANPMSVFYDFQTAYYMLAMYKDTGILSQEEMLILENTYSSTYAQGIMKADSEVTLKLFLKTFALLTYLDVNLDPESSDTIRNPEKNIEDLKNNLVKLNKLRTDFYKILYRKNLKCGTAISPDGYVINETAR